MKYLKNIHEHKNIISVVSKKIILGMVFVLGMSFTVDATPVIEMEQDCLMAAWDFGTLMGNSNPSLEYYWTDWFVNQVCAR